MVPLTDVHSLMKAHERFQQHAFQDEVLQSEGPPAAILVTPGSHPGTLLQPIVTGFVMALMTKRVLLVDSELLMQYFRLPLLVDWSLYRPLYSSNQSCEVISCGHPRQSHGCNFPQQGQGDNKQGHDHWRAKLIIYASQDYDMPLLQVNQNWDLFFKRYFPNGEIFSLVAAHLFQPNQDMARALHSVSHYSSICKLAIQLPNMRRFTHAEVQIVLQTYADLALQIVGNTNHSVFVAGSDVQHIQELGRYLPNTKVWWTNHTMILSGNVVVDMLLAAKCQHILASTKVGSLASAIAGKKPLHIISGHVVQSTTSEPCMYKASHIHWKGGQVANLLQTGFPLYIAQSQCHR